MLTRRLKILKKISEGFTGKNGEPKDDKEYYILKSLWVMLCSEFEGSFKDLVEKYIDSITKKVDIKNMHVCFLLQNFYGNTKDKESFTKQEIINLFKKNKTEVSYANFTKNKQATYKSFSVERLCNSLGIFLQDEEVTILKMLDGIASTRDAISHGDHGIEITRKQLVESISTVVCIYKMLKSKLK